MNGPVKPLFVEGAFHAELDRTNMQVQLYIPTCILSRYSGNGY